ncbi:ATP-binding cassette sub-family C member 9-like, partial [Diadema antillarum]|uniref:ATP-binding cassette sub-family C member 9-like n=1 Tax=Diadema antillarum TaxID=105358 RepID=UPI003A8AAE56
DDPLSALDIHVGSDMFYHGIMEFLVGNQRTVILVTHQVQYLEHADQVIYMKDCLIGHKGTMKEIGKKDPELMELWEITIRDITESEPESEDETRTAKERQKLVKQVLQTNKVKHREAEKGKSDRGGKIIEKEERITGSVSFKYYWFYVKICGPFTFFFVILFAVAQAAAKAGTDFWLSAWSDAANNKTNITKEEAQEIVDKYLGGYAGLNAANFVLDIIWNNMIIIAILFASRTMHKLMLERISHAPLRFFDITPIGRILNRFASDIQVLDERIGSLIGQALRVILLAVSGIIVNAIVSWYFLVAMLPLIIIYILVMKLFIRTAREIQRLVSITRSPVFAYFSETLGGLSTIRAYGLNNRFQRGILHKIEANNTALIYMQTGTRWLGVRLDTIGALTVFISGISSLAAAAADPMSFGPSLVGLAISYAISIASTLKFVVRGVADLEMAMNSMERTIYYSEVDVEESDGSVIPREDWPEEGNIIYENVSARYASDLDAVLSKVSVHFKAGQKIGICGRTGSGKSSLTLTLFRIIDMFEGNILIDGINIGMLPLKELRKRLAIIPQDPVLFTGTIRFNLDPLGEKSDDEIWQALEIAQLKAVVTGLEKGLDSEVSEGGENFSVGQRQLFCLGRAFLRKTKILVMDEATASIDYETDCILQQVVATAFQDRTVLTIAHRVSTIMDSDCILVLSKGKVAEHGTPEALLAKENGIFASLVAENK